MNAELLEGIRFFTRETKIMSGLSVLCGAGERTESAMDGEDVTESSVFDLASVTKLFTALCALRLREEGRLDFSRSVYAYDRRFEGLKDVTVEQLMSFALMLKTPGRIDACADRESGLRCLFGTAAAGLPERRAYSDIPAMVMKYVIEAAADAEMMDCVRERVLQPAGMTETWAWVPAERLADCQSYAGEHRLENGRRTVRQGPERGVPHDPKAALLQGKTGDLCGHAGLFSTGRDLERLCRALLSGEVVSPDSLRALAVNRTGHPLPDGTYTQYLGYLCYVRHPDQYFSEIPVYMGRKAFGLGGFTGNHLSVDPEHGLFTVFLGNRVKNRLTVLLPEEGKELRDYGLNPDGSGMFRWSADEVIPSSVQYVHQKDEHLHKKILKVLGLREIPWKDA